MESLRRSSIVARMLDPLNVSHLPLLLRQHAMNQPHRPSL